MNKVLLLLCFLTTLMFGALDINTASKKELMSLKGIGKTKAERIITHRASQPFKSVDELKNIKGFGEVLVQKLSSQLEVK